MKKFLLALLMVAVSAAGAWGITELDATVPANSALISTFAGVERETRAKVNEIIGAGTEAALSGLYSLSSYADFATALTAVGSTETILFVNKDATVAVDTTIPSTTTLVCSRGNTINVTSGKTLTINGPISCGEWQFFEGSGTVVFGANSVPDPVRPEWWGSTNDGVTSDTAAVTSAMTSLPTEGGRIKLGCKDWTFNLTVNKSHVWLDGCGAKSNTYWTTGQWQAYDVTLPVIKVTSQTYSGTPTTQSGFQLTNAHISGANSDGVKFGQRGIQIRAAEYFNVTNVTTEYFTTYQLLLGDSDLTVNEWVYFGNFTNTIWKAHGTYTTGDTIKLVQSGSRVTSQTFTNTALYGPAASGGYALNNVTDVVFTGGYFQIVADGHGLYRNASAVSGKFNLANLTVEGPTAVDPYTDTACVITSTLSGSLSNSEYSAIRAMGVTFTGNYCDGDGKKWLLYEREAVMQQPTLYRPEVANELSLVTGSPNGAGAYVSFDTQNLAANRTFLRRSYNGYTWDGGIDIYGTNGTRIEAGTTTVHPTLALVGKNTNTNAYPLSISGPYIAGYFQTSQDDNGSKSNTEYPVARFTRNNYNINSSSYGAVDGYGAYFDLRLSTYDDTGGDKLGEAQAGRFSWYWVDSDSSSLDSALKFSVFSDSSILEALTIKDGTLLLATNQTTQDIDTYFKNSIGSYVWANVFRNRITDTTAGAENSQIEFNTMSAGASGTKVTVTKRGLRVNGLFTPANATAACDKGEITWDNSTAYFCVDTDTWRKVTITSW